MTQYFRKTNEGFVRIPEEEALPYDYLLENVSTIRAYDTALEEEMALNANLKRIMVERANQQRGIHPKKEHNGYIVFYCGQYTEKTYNEIWDPNVDQERFKSEDRRKYAIANGLLRLEPQTITCWKSLIQTPYNACISSSPAIFHITEDLKEKGILNELGCFRSLNEDQFGSYADFGVDENDNPCGGLYKWIFRANYRVGFWEVELFTTDCLEVPEQYRPPQKK